MMPDHREGFVEFQGRNIWFRMDGDLNSGIPLLILHGGPGVPHDYLTPLVALSDDRPVILYDQLGCGNSDKSEDISLYTLDYFTQELEAVRWGLDLKEVHILGQSWGTMLAVQYILTKNPQGVHSLILSSPCLSASRWHDDQRRYINELPADIREIILKSEIEGTCDSPEYQEAMMVFYRNHVCRMDPWPECLEKSMEKMAFQVYEHMWGPSEYTITGTLKNYEHAHNLQNITIPTLFTCGRYDEASPESTRYYQSMLPGSRIVIFEDASHSHHLEQETAYLNTVREFLASVE
ncbi:proline iminopeptidase-family hydrolase [Methanospirillum hungatei]|uniref:proline iminopeptidase-family hydrolase n=1 Tax=Methanospirillum hungatei TaxID=2203 RepID=UPI0026E9F498|nr:proline iminopeptidase-family hydrolase [Methanospirillum hungatei]MCA1916527.1 proline iminopeptidase-family hydrolase [Methanospirillum hungatei]